MIEQEGTLYHHELGLVGNVWIRQNVLEGVGSKSKGHKHNFDHASLLTKGEVLVEVDGFEPKVFTAPTFIVIKKEHAHTFTSMSDVVNWYCVFALRDKEGLVTDMYSGDNSPYGIGSEDFSVDKLETLENETTDKDTK